LIKVGQLSSRRGLLPDMALWETPPRQQMCHCEFSIMQQTRAVWLGCIRCLGRAWPTAWPGCRRSSAELPAWLTVVVAVLLPLPL
jgi:hypothetical protein